MKIIVAAFVLTLSAVFCALGQSVPATDLRASAPVTIKGLQFVACTQAQWKLGPEKPHTIIVRLEITNETAGVLEFPTFDTFSLQLRTAAGKSVDAMEIRFGTVYTAPLRIQPGETATVDHGADLRSLGSRVGYFTYPDGTGVVLHAANLDFGSYLLSFSVESSAKKARKDANFFRAPSLTATPLWSGKGRTKEVPFQIVPGA